jgi:RNA-directed DNA polymerase
VTSGPNSVRWLAAAIHARRDLLLAVDGRIERFYKPFALLRPGKTPRQIDRPVGALKFIQSRIKEHLLSTFPFPYPLHGCVPGRSPLTNAGAHGKTPLLVNLDLAGFYPSVTCAMVYAVWRDVFQFGPPIATLLTRLTTYRGHLPQGAPTSGYLANIVLLPTAERIKEICADAACEVTFYVDDISVSGPRAREVIDSLISALHAHYLAVGRGKTKVMAGNAPQIATGYTINSGRPSVPLAKRDHVRELVHELHIRRTLGYDFTKLLRSIEGRIAHIERTNPGNAERLKRLLTREVSGLIASPGNAARRLVHRDARGHLH